MAEEETPVLDALAEITGVSIERCDLADRELMLARIAALVAVDAPPASYLLNAGTASDVGITLEDVQGILIAVAPVVGTPRSQRQATSPAHWVSLSPWPRPSLKPSWGQMAECARKRAAVRHAPPYVTSSVPATAAFRPGAVWFCQQIQLRPTVAQVCS